MNKFKEQGMKIVFMVAACVSILAVLLICLFLFASGIPAIGKIGPLEFLFGTEWRPSNDIYGIFPMIVASIYVTGGAILVGVPVALFTSVFMARYCPKKIYRPLKSGIELMAGVPSIVYGFFGLILMVPLIRQVFGGTGTSWLAASLLLAIMILPTIIGPTESALRSVPESYYEGSLASGRDEGEKYFLCDPSRGQVRYPGGGGPRYRTCHRRDHGGHHGGRKPGENAPGPSQGTPYPDGKHCYRDGICDRPSQRSADRHRRGAVRIHPDHQPVSLITEQEG